jgi:hypothetical protein
MSVKRSLEFEKMPAENVGVDSPLTDEKLTPLAIFTDESSAEQFVDTMATKLGLPVRVESTWTIGSRARRLSYEDTGRNLTLTVTISPGRVIEGNPSWWFSGTVKRNRDSRQMSIPSRLQPKTFKRDTEHLLAMLRRQQRARGIE